MYLDALQKCRGNIAAAARLLGLSRAQLAYRLKKAGGEATDTGGHPG
jgi:transcriptional regulator of acetoin/glycerol metabolism